MNLTEFLRHVDAGLPVRAQGHQKKEQIQGGKNHVLRSIHQDLMLSIKKRIQR